MIVWFCIVMLLSPVLGSVDSIRFLSYNMYLRPTIINEHGSDYKHERIDIFCREFMNDFDIIAFQEVFTDRWRKKLIRCARPLGFTHVVVGPRPTCKEFCRRFQLIDSGLLILSRYPLNNVQTMIYSEGIRSDGRVTKGAIYAEVQMNDAQIALVTTHTQASYENWTLTDPTTRIRLRQLNMLRTWIESIWPGNMQLLLMGDLNANSRPENVPLNPRRELPADFYVDSEQDLDNLTDYNEDEDEDEVFPWDEPYVVPEHTKEYEHLMRILRGPKAKLVWRDLLFEHLEFHPPTYGVGGFEQVITNTASTSVNHALDYILLLNSENSERNENRWHENQVQVRSFRFNSTVCPRCRYRGMTLQQCSDHYGVSVKMQTAPATLTDDIVGGNGVI